MYWKNNIDAFFYDAFDNNWLENATRIFKMVWNLCGKYIAATPVHLRSLQMATCDTTNFNIIMVWFLHVVGCFRCCVIHILFNTVYCMLFAIIVPTLVLFHVLNLVNLKTNIISVCFKDVVVCVFSNSQFSKLSKECWRSSSHKNGREILNFIPTILSYIS